MSNLSFTYGLATTKGTERKVNEDSAVALTWSDIPRFNGETVGLFIIADGTGTKGEGSKASQLAVQIVAQEIRVDLLQQSDADISLIMTAAFQEVNRQVIEAFNYGGTTLTAAILIGNQIYIAHVGDSRLYSINDNTITLMTKDHSLVTRYIEIIDPTPEDYEEPLARRVLFRAIGQSETLDVDSYTEQVAPNTQLLLCTDGLISLDSPLSEADLLPIIRNNEPQLACENLIELAQKAGSTDDISVIVIQINAA